MNEFAKGSLTNLSLFFFFFPYMDDSHQENKERDYNQKENS